MACKCGKCETEARKTHESTETHECDMHLMMLKLADEAWMELLKEKIKAEIQSTSGEHMDQVAKLVANTNKGKWAHMVTGKIKCEEYKNALRELMSAACKE